MTAYLVLSNGDAGSAERSRVERAASVLGRTADTVLRWTRDEWELESALAGLGTRIPVIVGGDGSIHAAVQALDRHGLLSRPVGLLPAGTGNDLARNLALPLDLDEAAEVIVAGRSVPLPLLRRGTRLIHNNIHVGMGMAAARRAEALKPALGRAAYPVGAVIEGLVHDGVELRVEVDGRTLFDGTALACVVMLGPSMGGGVEFLHDVDRSAPRADVLVVESTDRRRRLGLIPDFVRDGLLDRDDVTTARGSLVRVAAPEPLDADLDGEIERVGTEMVLEVVPSAWRVFVPSIDVEGCRAE